MQLSSELDQLAAALAEAQGEYPSLDRNKQGKIEGEGRQGSYSYTYSYSDLAECVDKAKPVNSKHGLSVTQHIGYDGEWDTLTTVLLHKSGQYMGETMRLRLKKLDAQGQGSGISYAKRYAYCAILGLVADDDDDGKAVSNSYDDSRSRSQPKRQNRQPQRKTTDGRPVSKDGEVETPLQELIDKLSDEGKAQLEERKKKANYPEPVPPSAEKTIRKWCAEIQEQQDQGRPF